VAHNIPIIEDACEALGARYRDRLAGTLGNYGVFAFYPNKQITTGEGAVIVTDDEQAAKLMNALRNQGRAPGDTWLQHTHLGYNYRLDEMSAALGEVQMRRLDALMCKRQQVADWYQQRLSEIPGVEPQVSHPKQLELAGLCMSSALQGLTGRESQKLAQAGIPTRPYFLPIHLQPYMMERFGYREGVYPVTEDLGKRGLALPFSGVMEEGQVDRVCQVLRKIVV
jgi:dTDP-4-amino-4,6-dideoxygalactose transaminase